MSFSVKRLDEEIVDLENAMREVVSRSAAAPEGTEEANMTKEERQKFFALRDQKEIKAEQRETAKCQEEAAKCQAIARNQTEQVVYSHSKATYNDVLNTFRLQVTRGKEDLFNGHKLKEWKASAAKFNYRGVFELPISRAQTNTLTEGGEFHAPSIFGGVEQTLLFTGGLRNFGFVFNAPANGVDIDYAFLDGTAVVADKQAAEGDGQAGDAVVTSKKTISVDTYLAAVPEISIQIIEDASTDLLALLNSEMVERLNRATNAAYVTALAAGSTLGRTTAAPTAVTYTDMIKLWGSVDPSYEDGSEAFVMTKNFEENLLLLVDSTGKPLIKPDITAAGFATIQGKRLIRVSGLPDVAASAKVCYYGMGRKFLIKDVGGVRYGSKENMPTSYDLTIWAGVRTGALVVQPKAIKYLQMHS